MAPLGSPTPSSAGGRQEGMWQELLLAFLAHQAARGTRSPDPLAPFLTLSLQGLKPSGK